MTDHLDPDVLADFREGLLGRRHSARIRAHLGTCPACASLDKDLAQVTELLASAPVPKMPGHLAARLDRALAAESAARTANPDPAGQATRAADTASGAARGPGRRPLRTGRHSWQPRPATLGVAAAIAAVLAVGGYGLASLHSGAFSAFGISAGRPGHKFAGPLSPNALGPRNGGLAKLPTPTTGRLSVIESGTDYLPGRLASQVQAVLARHPLGPALPLRTPAAASGGTGRLQSCVDAVTGGRSSLLVDEARYQGRPATIIVLPPTASRAGQVWVTGPACSATSPGLITHIQLGTG